MHNDTLKYTMEHNNKIKNLTDKIYREGIEKVKEDAEFIISESEKKSAEIIDGATKEADKILDHAKREALKFAERMKTELHLSSQQALGVLRKEITELILAKVLEEPVQKAFADHKFMQRMLEMVIRNWNPGNGDAGLNVLLPEDKITEAEQYFKEKTGDLLNKGLSLRGNENLQNGFEISPEKGNYKISITDSSFSAFLSAHYKEGIVDFLFKQES